MFRQIFEHKHSGHINSHWSRWSNGFSCRIPTTRQQLLTVAGVLALIYSDFKRILDVWSLPRVTGFENCGAPMLMLPAMRMVIGAVLSAFLCGDVLQLNACIARICRSNSCGRDVCLIDHHRRAPQHELSWQFHKRFCLPVDADLRNETFNCANDCLMPLSGGTLTCIWNF